MYTIRQATKEDINRMAQIESICFEEAEAASLQSFQERFAVFWECFFVLEVDGLVVGHINGCINDAPELPDELYSNPKLHKANGTYQTVFGLAVDPKYQKSGYASALMKHFIENSKLKGQKAMVLTCKDYLVEYYQGFGFTHQGLSSSNHGGAQWNDMLLTF